MDERHAMTRREFLYSGLAMVSTIGSTPAFLTRSSCALADSTERLVSKPGVPQDRVLVVVQLSGGNDGLNTVIPFGQSAYYDNRPGIKIAEDAILPLDTGEGVGLHPAMRPIHEMVGEGLASIVQGVGYPNPNRSHFASMDIWHAGDTLADQGGAANLPRGTGWVGRAMDADLKRHDRDGLGCICLGSEAPLAARGVSAQPVSLDEPTLFRWSARDLDPAVSKAYDALNHARPGRSDGPGRSAGGDSAFDDPTAFIFRTAMDAQVASDRVRKAVAQKAQTEFPRNGLARQLAMVAAMIRAELPTRVYYVAMGGFDTHANQPSQHQRLLGEFASSMRAFYRELEATGHRSRVVTMAFSEFGRRVRQNASGGTDHGAAGPLFLFGDHVKPGLVGKHPSLDPSKLEDGDLRFAVDFRGVYAELLDRWMKLDSRAVLAGGFKGPGAVTARG